jgi:hypothetical protein
VKINSDFRDLLQSSNAAGARYLIVGGYAVMVHTEPRYTKDLDIWIEPELENARLVLAALKVFGAPTEDVSESDFTELDVFFQIGIDPVRIDIMTTERRRIRRRVGAPPDHRLRRGLGAGALAARSHCRESGVRSPDRRDAKRLQRD